VTTGPQVGIPKWKSSDRDRTKQQDLNFRPIGRWRALQSEGILRYRLSLSFKDDRMRLYLLLAIILGGSFIGSSCGGSGIGDPCIPEEEYLTTFPGFNVGEVNVESRSFQCLTRVCLVNHFQGRISCPYGQTEEMAATCTTNPGQCMPNSTGDTALQHESSCRIPDRDGADVLDRVAVEVDEQYEERPAVDAVYCSCRCSGPNGTKDPNSRYCDCPSGFSCEDIFADLGPVAKGKGQLAGAYCVREGTQYNAANPPQTPCRSGDPKKCGYYKDTNAGLVGVNPPNPEIVPESVF